MTIKPDTIDTLIQQTREALEGSRYGDALANARMAWKEAKKQLNRVKTKVNRIDAVTEENMGKIAEQKEKLQAYLSTIGSLMQTIRKEKKHAEKFRQLIEKIREEGITEKIATVQSEIDNLTSKPRTLNGTERYLLCLRRWNSFTPFLASYPGSSQGGGYFLAWCNKGIVIDPGINFIQNFLSSGFSICDIDSVILTHSHVDHTADLEAILTLMHELNKYNETNNRETHKVDFFLNVGSANKFMQLFSVSYDSVGNIVVLKQDDNYQVSPEVSLATYASFHTDLYANRAKCLGLILNCKSEKKKISFGLTSDTGYSPDLANYYTALEDGLIVLHIGSILEKELSIVKPREKFYEEHLGLRGIYNLIYDIKPKLAIISEIGEELKDTILPIVKDLGDIFPNTKVLPADIGLRIDLSSYGSPFKVECFKCKTYKNISEIMFSPPNESSGSSGIQFTCKTCGKQ